MRRLLTIATTLCLLVCICLLSTQASAETVANGTCGENLTWVLDDQGTLTISGTGDMTDYSDGTRAPWYTWRNEIKSLIIEDGVTDIGNDAFSGCTGLTSITIGNGVTSIGEETFRDCTGLTSVTIGNSVTSIGWCAFDGCTSLTEITIPDSVTSIGDSAFGGCNSLESITIPFVGGSKKTATDTYQYPFGYIFGTSSYSGGVATTQKYYGSGTTSTTSATYYIPASLKSVTVTGGEVLCGAFYNCTGLTEITIPDSVTSIGGMAFCGCTGLTEITIPNSVTSIGNSAFAVCTGLKEITIPDSVTSIGYDAFYNCTGLKEITIPDSVTSIGSSAFDGCTGLKSVTIGDGVTYIGGSVFEDCTGLTSVTIGSGVTSIGNWAFVGCTNINVVFYQGTEAQRNQINIDNGGNNYLENATWHYEVEKRIFADQDCYYCAECDTYFLHNGKYALATVTFLDEDGSILSQQRLRYKQAVDVPNPTKPADNAYTYVFDSWDQEVVPCAGNATYTATYKSAYIDYTIKFADEDGTVISEKTYHWNDVVEVPADPTKAADNTYTYTFAGWDQEVVPCAGNAAYTATYNSHYIDYTVVFENEDGTALSSKTYHYGDKVTVPADPAKAADNTYTYTFAGWDKDVVDCVGDATYTATYTPVYIDYTVVFKNWNGDVLFAGSYHYGQDVVVPATPTRDADETYTYSFQCWDEDVEPCYGDKVYVAEYRSSFIDYTITFQYEDGTVIAKYTCHYGEELSVPENVAVPEELGDNYAFAGWDMTVTVCEGDAVYTAVFEQTYTLGDLDGDGELSDWDGVMLARYLAGWPVEVDVLEALDIDGDGEITDWDGVLFDRYLAGWDVTIG